MQPVLNNLPFFLITANFFCYFYCIRLLTFFHQNLPFQINAVVTGYLAYNNRILLVRKAYFHTTTSYHQIMTFLTFLQQKEASLDNYNMDTLYLHPSLPAFLQYLLLFLCQVVWHLFSCQFLLLFVANNIPYIPHIFSLMSKPVYFFVKIGTK